MKIVWTDNFNRETISEKLVADHVRVHESQIIIEALQKSCRHGDDDWYKLVPDDYVLYEFEP